MVKSSRSLGSNDDCMQSISGERDPLGPLVSYLSEYGMATTTTWDGPNFASSRLSYQVELNILSKLCPPHIYNKTTVVDFVIIKVHHHAFAGDCTYSAEQSPYYQWSR